MSDDELVNEPVFTGYLQTQLSGDIALAKTHQREGRQILGQLLINHGVNERIAAGEPGGFFKTNKTLEDGTRVTAWTNNGSHVLRIDTPRVPVSIEEPEEEIPEAESWEGESSIPRSSVSHEDAPVIPGQKFDLKWGEEEEEEEKKETVNYMWVGIKSTSLNVPYYAMNAVMVEPAPTEPDANGNIARGALGTSNYWEAYGFDLSFNDDDTEASIGPGDFNSITDFADGVVAHYHAWWPTGQPTLTMGWHSFEVRDGGFFLCSANGLRAFSIALGYGSGSEAQKTRWMPYDPLLPEDDQVDGRQFGDRSLFGQDIPERAWDIVYLLDSTGEDEAIDPYDPRPHIAASRVALEKAGMASGEAIFLEGDYILAVHLVDAVPELVSSRGGEVIPLSILPSPNNLRLIDYDGYMGLDGAGVSNVEVEIEVRLGKAEEMQVFTFVTIIETSDDRFSNTSPFGIDTFDACTAEGGPNPLGPNFAQQLLAINPINGTADWAPNMDVALPALGGGTFAYPGDERQALDIYVFGGFGASIVADADFPGHAGYAVYRAMETATSGAYGHMLFNEFSEAAIAAAFAGAINGYVWHFDGQTGLVTQLPIISAPTDYPSPPFTAAYYWFYPYKQTATQACRNSLGVLLAAAITGWSLESGQTTIAGEPTPPDCC